MDEPTSFLPPLPSWVTFLMINRRSTLLIVILVATAAVTAGVIWVTALPHPRDASRDQLVHWLVLRDLRTEPAELRLALVRRLEEEFGENVDWDGVSEQLTQSQQQRVRDNLIVLLRPWFMDKLDGYLSLSMNEKVPYVDKLLDTITAWRGVDTLQTGADTDGKQKLFEIFMQRAVLWQKEAKPLRAEQIGDFMLAIQIRYVGSRRANVSLSP
jgi:hypothetical protein